MYDKELINYCLNQAHKFAVEHSGCSKVQVGALILHRSHRGFAYGANRGVGYDCLKDGCRRIKLYGEASKEHRLPSDCNSIHSEIDAISFAAKIGLSTKGASIFVTRYPCEACARAIVRAGIKAVYYGREQEISEYTKQIFDSAGVEYHHILDWKAPDCTY